MTAKELCQKVGITEANLSILRSGKAKGIRFHTVNRICYYLQCDVGDLLKFDGNLDEERRLFYVAVTRAKDRLYLSVPRSKKTSDGGMCPAEPSQFVREIPPEMYNEHEVRSVSPAYERPKPRGDTWRTTWRR